MQKKKLVALAIAAAVSAPAFADTANVNIYGVINASFDSVDNGSAGATQGTRTSKVSSNASRIGFKGSEDLGDGLKAVWQIESLVAVDNAGGTFATRNSFVGLSSANLGTVLLGRNDTPYKTATRKLDLFADTLGDNRSLLGSVGGVSAFTSFDGRQPDSVTYVSPAFSGFTVSAAYVAGAETATASADQKGDVWSLAGQYDAGPLYASVSYETHKLGSAGTGTLAGATAPAAYLHAGSSESAWKLGLGYKIDAFEVNAVYEKSSDNLGGTGAPAFLGAPALVTGADVFGHSTYYLAGKYSISSSDAVKLAYAHAGDLAGAASGTDTSARHFSLGYDHNLSKRTTVYALYTKLNNGANVRYALGATGWTSGATNASAAGADPSAWSLGVKHSF